MTFIEVKWCFTWNIIGLKEKPLYGIFKKYSYAWLTLVWCKSDEEIDAVASITDDNKDEDVKMIKVLALHIVTLSLK